MRSVTSQSDAGGRNELPKAVRTRTSQTPHPSLAPRAEIRRGWAEPRNSCMQPGPGVEHPSIAGSASARRGTLFTPTQHTYMYCILRHSGYPQCQGCGILEFARAASAEQKPVSTPRPNAGPHTRRQPWRQQRVPVACSRHQVEIQDRPRVQPGRRRVVRVSRVHVTITRTGPYGRCTHGAHRRAAPQ